MTEKTNPDNSQDTKQNKRESCSSLSRKAFAIMVIALAVLIVNYEYLLPLCESYFTSDAADTSNSESNKDQQYAALPSDDSVKLDDTVVDEVEKAKLQTLEIKDMERYRSYLVGAALLARKFYADTDYDKEVSYLLSSEIIYPDKVKNALLAMKSHRDKYLSEDNKQYLYVKLEGGFVKNLMSKIVTIRKENPIYYSMEEERKNLDDQLIAIEGYFYSHEFLKYCLNYD